MPTVMKRELYAIEDYIIIESIMPEIDILRLPELPARRSRRSARGAKGQRAMRDERDR